MAEQSRSDSGGVLAALLWKRREHWVVTLYPDAREASGTWRKPGGGELVAAAEREPDRTRSAAEGARRAKSKIRLYCASNSLNRLGTLTYAGDGQHDPEELREQVAVFFRRLRAGIEVKYLPTKQGIRPGGCFPYLWVPQWHPGGHGLHVHFAVGRYIPRGFIESCWPHGFVDIRLLSNLTAPATALAEARLAARYLARYVGKQLDDERRRLGLHRYEVAEGFQPVAVELHGRTLDDVIAEATRVLGGAHPSHVWRSDQSEGWRGPPACWVEWPA
jgi:hypothetical protein